LLSISASKMVEDVIVVSVTSGVMLADRSNRVILAETPRKQKYFKLKNHKELRYFGWP
tara:strand:+ start:1627 stop:1800 length:174 start_codon:yes stop_codon:yes gene_type:complete